MGEIAAYSTTRIESANVDETNFVGVDNLLPDGKGKRHARYTPNTSSLTRYETGDILLGNIRPYLRKIWLANEVGGCSGDVLAIRIRERYRKKISPGFLYQVLAGNDFFSYDMQCAKGTKMPRGDKAAILKYRIPIPDLPVQEKISTILDKFDTLVNDLSTGLPAEIAARRQQYEHYRDRLLTFRESV